MLKDLKGNFHPPGSILIELNRAVKAFALYPGGHPALKEILEKTYHGCKDTLRNLGEITYSVDRKGFYLEDSPISSLPPLKNLAKDLFYKRVKKITFTNRMTMEEWFHFIDLIARKTSEITGKGGITRLLVERGVKGLWIDEVKYEEIMEGAVEERKDQEVGVEEIEENIVERGGVDIQIEKLVKDFQERFKRIEVEEETEGIDALLEALEREKDPIRYEGLVRSLVVRVVELKEEGRWDDAFKVLHTFARHSMSHRNETMALSAHHGLRDVFDRRVEEECFRRFVSKKDEKVTEQIGEVLIAMGEEMVGPCIERLVEEERLYPRKKLFNLLVAFGEKARRMVERRLQEAGEWYIKRQMVSVLGAIGNPASLQVLKDVLDCDDIRVKREAMKALARIGTEEAVDMLIGLIDSKEQAISLQAIVSLGAIRASKAIPHLISIIESRGLSSKLYERKREAIKALGSIGDERALPLLKRVLRKKRLWRRKVHDELRCLSAIALASIGGEEAEKALKEVMAKSKGDLYYACLNGLERMGR